MKYGSNRRASVEAGLLPLASPDRRRRTGGSIFSLLRIRAHPRPPSLSACPLASVFRAEVSTANTGSLVFHFPRVKSGHSTGALPLAMDVSDLGGDFPGTTRAGRRQTRTCRSPGGYTRNVLVQPELNCKGPRMNNMNDCHHRRNPSTTQRTGLRRRPQALQPLIGQRTQPVIFVSGPLHNHGIWHTRFCRKRTSESC